MFYVYVIREKTTNDIYIGVTSDLKRRLSEHNSSRGAKFTVNGEWQLVYYEAFASNTDARIREKRLKHYGRARYQLYARLKNSFADQKWVWGEGPWKTTRLIGWVCKRRNVLS